jgi:hypothetical protein
MHMIFSSEPTLFLLYADIVNDKYCMLHEYHLVWHKFCTPWRLADTLRFRMVGAGIMIDERRG